LLKIQERVTMSNEMVLRRTMFQIKKAVLAWAKDGKARIVFKDGKKPGTCLFQDYLNNGGDEKGLTRVCVIQAAKNRYR
jgi:hypothetical protein